jgi:hypothetical protein
MGISLTCLPQLMLAQLPTAPWSTFQGVRATETLKTSHRPHGRSHVSRFVRAGWWCLCLGCHIGHLIMHHQWEHSWPGARSCSKVPLAPMGKCLLDMSISILIFYDGCCLKLPVWSTCLLRLKLQKFSSPPHGKIADVLARVTLAQLRTLRSTTDGTCHTGTLKTSHRPDGNIADGLASNHTLAQLFGQLQGVRAAVTFQSSHRPDGIFTCFAHCLQGGGVYFASSTVTFSSCTITGNTASSVRAHTQYFPLPRWESC